jgi:hypothetical protein
LNKYPEQVKVMAFSLYPVQVKPPAEFKKQLATAEAFGLRVAQIQSVDDISAYLVHVNR